MKDFDSWNNFKKNLELLKTNKYAHQREIWWCSIGINIGVEIDGKNEKFERPVIILKIYNKDAMIILPLTTKEKNAKFNYRIKTKEKIIWAKITQMKMISSKRLIRKIGFLDKDQFNNLREVWIKSL